MLVLLLIVLLRATGWQRGSIHIVCATGKFVSSFIVSTRNESTIDAVSFGMGVDKRNVRFVMHHSPPSSLDAYYQVWAFCLQYTTHHY
jgi:hypothetical protein